jgi:hypothetical protein
MKDSRKVQREREREIVLEPVGAPADEDGRVGVCRTRVCQSSKSADTLDVPEMKQGSIQKESKKCIIASRNRVVGIA